LADKRKNIGYLWDAPPTRQMSRSRVPYTIEKILKAAPHAIETRSGFAIWFTQPLGLLSELGEIKHVNIDMARFFIDRTESYLTATGQLDAPRVGVHDWSTMISYDADAKSAFMDYVKERKQLITHSSVVLPVHNALARVGVRTASTVLALLGQRLHFPDDVAKPIEELGLRAAR
jgi:hypothetical protein